jgi:4-diphosphocytidyl-2-C-methyl-D-erythritol kinase
VNLAALSITEDAPAKVNLALHVTGRRADGYHLLESLVVFTGFGDRISVRPSAADEFVTAGPYGEALPTDAGNLVIRARDALRAANPASPPVSIVLEKNLPIASGIGGGSSDAAATLRALSRLWPMEDASLECRIAPTLGADVPMCLNGCTLTARGVGEILEPVSDFPPLAMVLVNPGVAVSTPSVFQKLASKENPPLPGRPARWDRSSLIDWLTQTRNDLEGPAIDLAPVVSDALNALRAAGADFARMSGSGATCFGLFDSVADAEAAAITIRQADPSWFVVATQSVDRDQP